MPVIGRREIPIKRDEVHEWLKEHGKKSKKKEMLAAKLAEKGIDQGLKVDMGFEEGPIPLVDLIMREVDSYRI